MLLTADIGNTSITLGIFEGDEIVGIYRISSNIHYSIEKYEELLSNAIKENVTECIIASVVNDYFVFTSFKEYKQDCRGGKQADEHVCISDGDYLTRTLFLQG